MVFDKEKLSIYSSIPLSLRTYGVLLFYHNLSIIVLFISLVIFASPLTSAMINNFRNIKIKLICKGSEENPHWVKKSVRL